MAREEIRSYDFAIAVTPAAVLEIEQTIVVNAEADQIQHGIFPNLPKTLIGDDGSRAQPVIEVKSVTRNGAPEPFHIEDLGAALRVWMGSGDVLVPPGVHTYGLSYTMTGAVHDLDGKHAISFELIAPGWQFPILAAGLSVTVPDTAAIATLKARVGTAIVPAAGSWMRVSASKATFRAKLLPDADKGLSIVIAFEGGIAAPSRSKLDRAP